jgi:tetratricopeptide (TPR) repeat protein
MSRFRPFSALVAALLCSAALSATRLPVAAADDDKATDTVRPEVGKPLQEAQKLVADHKYKEAMAKVQQADAAKNKTPYESFVIDEVRGFAARGAGDTVTAIKSFEAIVAANRLPAAEQLRYEQTLALDYYTAKDYPKSIQWATRYAKEGGSDGQVRTLLAQSYYLAGDYATAGKELQAQIEAARHAGQTPPEGLLTMLADSALKQKDEAGYTEALRLLVAAYPKKEYWLPLLHQIEREPSFAGRLQLDLDRIKLATGTLASPADYLDMTQLALADGLPGEAKRTIGQRRRCRPPEAPARPRREIGRRGSEDARQERRRSGGAERRRRPRQHRPRLCRLWPGRQRPGAYRAGHQEGQSEAPRGCQAASRHRLHRGRPEGEGRRGAEHRAGHGRDRRSGAGLDPLRQGACMIGGAIVRPMIRS